MAQIMPVPGPSQDDFDALSGQVSTLNGKITQKNLGAFGSLSNIESALVTQLNSMSVGSSQEIFFTTTASGISVFNVWSGYVGTIYKTDTNRGVVSVIPHGTEPKTINGLYVNSAWTWESLYGRKQVAFNNVNISTAGGYMKIANYSDIGITKDQIISIYDAARNFSGVVSFHVNADGLYLYCSNTVSNGNITFILTYT